MTLLLWLGIWVGLSFAAAPLLGAVLREVRGPVPVRSVADGGQERRTADRGRVSA